MCLEHLSALTWLSAIEHMPYLGPLMYAISRVKHGQCCCQWPHTNTNFQSSTLSTADVVWPNPCHTHNTPSHSFFCHWPTAPSIAPSLLWLCAVIGHTALALLVVSPAVACGGAVQAADLINPEASAVSSKLQLCFPTMTSPPPSLPTQAQPPQLRFLSHLLPVLMCTAWRNK